jgi:hypothetical protein
MPLGCKLDVYFHFQLLSPGLIVYELCADGELEKLGLKVLIALLAAIALELLTGGLGTPILEGGAVLAL